MASAIESDSEHDQGASRTPNTVRTVARLHRSTPRCPVLCSVVHSASTAVSRWLATFRSKPVGLGWDRGRRPRRRPTHLRLLASAPCYPDPRGPDTSCRNIEVSRESARGGPSTSPGNPPLPASSRGPLRRPSREGRPTTSARGAFRPGILGEEQRHVESTTVLGASSSASSDCL
jgi:hypothetical protein